MEALQCAQDGQLWGPALVFSAQLGDQVSIFLSLSTMIFFSWGNCIDRGSFIVRNFDLHFVFFVVWNGLGFFFQFYVDTVRKMALRQLVAGSPLRTLCLLIAGQPADAFSSETTTDGVIPSAVNMSQQVMWLCPARYVVVRFYIPFHFINLFIIIYKMIVGPFRSLIILNSKPCQREDSKESSIMHVASVFRFSLI